jgi:hypothetical protein
MTGRIPILNAAPLVECGRYTAKAVTGETFDVSATVFREGPFRVYFFSLEESRMHVHVSTADGEAKFWLEPEIELAANYGLPEHVRLGPVR